MLKRWLAVGLLVLATALPAASTAAASRGVWAGAGIVQAPGGRYLTDAFGRRLQLHGVNLVAKCGGGALATPAAGTPCVGPARGPQPAFVLSPTARDPGRRFTAADARSLARLGFNVVRLGVIWQGLEPGPRGVGANDPRYCAPHRAGTRFPPLGKADPYDAATVRAYLRRTDRIVTLLAKAGIRVVIDMHQDAWGSTFSNGRGATPWNGEGAPAWATCTGQEPFTPPSAWISAYFTSAVQTAIHHFWANDVRGDLQGQFARVWQAVARHFRASADVIGYEVFNEPSDFKIEASRFDRELQCAYGGLAHEPHSCAGTHVHAMRAGLIGAIQAADPEHVVLFEPAVLTDFGSPETIGITEPLRFRRVALAFHVYGPPAKLLASIARERAHTRTDQPGGPPWIMDEFGATNETASIAATASAADRAGLSWTYWAGLQLHDPTGNPFEGLIDERTHRPSHLKALALAVPFPAATAGTPGAQSFNAATDTFSYRYRVARRVDAPTEIVVPGYVFGHGYRVRVQGARVISSANASVLKLTARRRATRVELTVTPG